MVRVVLTTSGQAAKPPLVLPFSPGDDHQRIVGEWPLKLESFLGRRTHPDIDFLARREDGRHGLRVNRSNYLVRFRRQKREQIIRRLAFLHLSNGSPAGPDSGEERERPGGTKCEPYWRPASVREKLVLGEAGEWDDAPMLDPEPSAPVTRTHVANIGDARIRISAFNANTGDGIPHLAIVNSRPSG
jgi:hypothetical protein